MTIVIRCRNEARHLGPVLDAVLHQEGAPSYEVVALDSGSQDETLDLLGRYPIRVERLPPERFTLGRALNVGTDERQRRGTTSDHPCTTLRRGYSEVRALMHLPSYALARTVCYTRGVRDGARRYGGEEGA